MSEGKRRKDRESVVFFISSIVSLLPPAYHTTCAVLYQSLGLQMNWMSYWVIFVIWRFIELMLKNYRFRFYNLIRLILVVILQINNAEISGAIYMKIIRPVFGFVAPYTAVVSTYLSDLLFQIKERFNVDIQTMAFP